MPRVRLIAGPNGSGKTTLFKTLQKHPDVYFGQYINPDDVADTLKGISIGNHHIADQERYQIAQKICVGLRDNYLKQNLSLTYESVMSHSSHMDYIRRAKDLGFKPYLYYICINDPLININRVANRVEEGGHSVPENKIVSRYERSLSNLMGMIKFCHRVYFWDNSSDLTLFAECTENGLLKINVDLYNNLEPTWFQENVLELWNKDNIRHF